MVVGYCLILRATIALVHVGSQASHMVPCQLSSFLPVQWKLVFREEASGSGSDQLPQILCLVFLAVRICLQILGDSQGQQLLSVLLGISLNSHDPITEGGIFGLLVL